MNVVARVADIDWRTDSVLYTSTHDSDTLAGWWQRWGREHQPQLAAGAPARRGRAPRLAAERPRGRERARDHPGAGPARARQRGADEPAGNDGRPNWKWKLEQPLTAEQAATLAAWTAAAGRRDERGPGRLSRSATAPPRRRRSRSPSGTALAAPVCSSKVWRSVQPVSFASRWIETDVSAEVVRTRWMSSAGGSST